MVTLHFFVFQSEKLSSTFRSFLEITGKSQRKKTKFRRKRNGWIGRIRIKELYARRIDLYNRLDDRKKSWFADHVIIPLNDKSFFSILIAVSSIRLGNVQITIMKILVIQCSIDASTYPAGPMGRTPITDMPFQNKDLCTLHTWRN